MTATFLVTTLIIVATPGTGALFTIAAGLARGARASIIAAAGCTLGIVPQVVAAITGLAALLHASAVAFQSVKIAGVVYLLYMAWATVREKGALAAPEGEAPQSSWRVIRSAVLLNLLNPKLTIFFFAFLPQFVPATDPHGTVHMLELSGVFMGATFVVFACYGVFAASVRRSVLTRPRVMTWLRRVFAGTFVALGAKLATAAR